MKLFIRKLLYIILPLILLMYLLDLFFSANLKNCYSGYQGEFEVWEDIYNNRIDDDCYIYGSSRAWVHIDPTIIENVTGVTAYNMGMDGQKIQMQLFRHHEIMKYARKPKYILYSLDLTSFTVVEGLYLKEQFLPYMLWNKEMESAVTAYEGYSVADFRIPLWRYVGDFKSVGISILQLANPRANPLRNKGYFGVRDVWNDDFDNAKATMRSYHVELDTASINSFKNFIVDCKKQDIQLIFVNTPQYSEGQEFVENKDEILSLYTEWSKEYDIPYLEYLHDTICDDQQYFYNSTHMNIIGSQLFSEKMANDLKPYLNPLKE